MDFTEYLNQNPEAKAEQATLIETAKAKALKDDRERSAKITQLYGNSEMAVNAINEGTSVGDLAVAEKEQAMAENKAAGEQNLGTVVPKNQVPEKPEEDSKKSAEKKDEDAVKAYLDSQKKGVK